MKHSAVEAKISRAAIKDHRSGGKRKSDPAPQARGPRASLGSNWAPIKGKSAVKIEEIDTEPFESLFDDGNVTRGMIHCSTMHCID